MKITQYISILLLLIFSNVTLAAKDGAKFIGSCKQVVSVGERFKLVYELNEDGSNFVSPKFGKFHKLSGPNKSSSSSIQIINGNYQQSHSTTYTFLLSATTEGVFKINPASVRVNGKTYVSNAITVKVQKKTSNNSNAQSTSGVKKTQSGVIQDDDVYIKTIVSNRNPYIGEQIIVTNRIYTKIPVSNLSLEKAPSFQGFWSKNLTDNNTKLKQSTKVINGHEYIVADISKYAIFPQKSGKLTIEATNMKGVAQVKVEGSQRRSRDPFDDFFNDPFFNRNVKNIEVLLNSKPITVNVKALPQAGKPESFDGAVGDFSFTSSIDNDSINANDAISISLKLTGTGNLELIKAPTINFPGDFETYEPKISNNIKTSNRGVSGNKKIEYLAIARNPGDFTIGQIDFSYFNPADKKYHNINAGPYNIHVIKGKNGNSSGISYSSSAQEDIRFIGQDIRHIKQSEMILKPKGEFLFGTSLYYLLVALPIIALFIFVLVYRKSEKRKGNVKLMKTRKANKLARTKLKKAEKLMNAGNNKEFYDEIAQAIWGYISDKFHITQAEMSIENVQDTLRSKDTEEGVISGFVDVLNNIEFVRFAPGDSSSKMKSIYEESLNTITMAERAFK